MTTKKTKKRRRGAYLRLPADVLQRVDTFCSDFKRRFPGFGATRDEALTYLVHKGLEAEGTEAPPPRSDPPQFIHPSNFDDDDDRGPV